MEKRYQIVTDAHDNGGLDQKQSYLYIKDAIKFSKQYLKDGYEGVGIYDILSGQWVRFYGEFRKNNI